MKAWINFKWFSWDSGHGGTPWPIFDLGDALLLESGDFFLLESGVSDKLLLEPTA